ncbi:P-type conjugative transfer protein TrbG [Alcaligenes aquatilis]|uniref:P-type conjugative transfer protein TrbG n=1 Tax=Alcaligenes aquatilis TaxID=323284 RepID=A0A3G2HSI8_9BURK|nr:P-type conjugative transfer protein TrbG [Alcaligenes aquatilis]AYN20100.1 P-type conjugative transfer protein TrbG [Alcaligenes aquatilis]
MKIIVSLLAVLALAGCASRGAPPPVIALDEPPVPAEAVPVAPPAPVNVVAIPEPLPLPGQLKAIEDRSIKPEPVSPATRIAQANREARMAPRRDGFINAIQVWPYSDGALYQVYASPGRVTLILLQPGERLIDMSAGDTVRWIVGDSMSGSGKSARANLQIKPVRPGLKTNLVVTTDRRIYLLELTSTESAWMASVSWDYPQDRLDALKAQDEASRLTTPMAAGLSVDQLRFRYEVTGDAPSWRPLRAFDDGQKVYIQFPAGIAQGDLPPLFLVGPDGDLQLVNHRYQAPYYIVDRLFGAVELRLGGNRAQAVRISRTDGKTAWSGL